MSVDTESILARLREALPDVAIALRTNPSPSGQHSLLVDAARIPDVCRFLRDTLDLDFDFLSNVTGVDWPDAAKADLVAVLTAVCAKTALLPLIKRTLAATECSANRNKGEW